MNSNLAKTHSAVGIWGRHVLRGLRIAGADVVALPDEHPAMQAARTTRPGPIRRNLWAALRNRWVALCLEPYLLIRGLLGVARIASRVWRYRSRVDVILGRHSEFDFSCQLAALLLRRPLVCEVHSADFIMCQYRGRAYSPLRRAIEQWQWGRCDRIWVNSSVLAEVLHRNGVPYHRIDCIPFGVDLQQFPCDDRHAHMNGESVEVVFAGSFYDWHGTEILLKAFAAARRRCGRLRLTMIGDGGQRHESEQLARRLGIREAVLFTGWLPNEVVIERLGRADIGVAPYLELEYFFFDPAKILEYMASGLAVVASAQGRAEEMLQDGECGILVPPGDADSLAGALVRLAEDRELRERLGRSARRRAEAVHDSRQMAGRVLALLEETVSRSAPPRRLSRPAPLERSRR